MVMVEVNNLYTCLGQSLRFPHNDIMPYIKECIDILEKGQYPEEILKELRSFKRAVNLHTIKSMYRDQEFPFDDVAKGELPDNLSVILFFIGHLKNEELKRNFVKTYVIMSM